MCETASELSLQRGQTRHSSARRRRRRQPHAHWAAPNRPPGLRRRPLSGSNSAT